jgi:hypothetical protein
MHVDHREQHHASGAVPTRGFGEPGDPNLALHKTQLGIAIRSLLNDARGA